MKNQAGLTMTLTLDEFHPLLVLKEVVEWEKIKSLIEKSLDKDQRGLRRDLDHHVRVMILQMYLRGSYRELVERLKGDAYARLFCGLEQDDHPYGPTAYIKFINEISPQAYEDINFFYKYRKETRPY